MKIISKYINEVTSNSEYITVELTDNIVINRRQHKNIKNEYFEYLEGILPIKLPDSKKIYYIGYLFSPSDEFKTEEKDYRSSINIILYNNSNKVLEDTAKQVYTNKFYRDSKLIEQQKIKTKLEYEVHNNENIYGANNKVPNINSITLEFMSPNYKKIFKYKKIKLKSVGEDGVFVYFYLLNANNKQSGISPNYTMMK